MNDSSKALGKPIGGISDVDGDGDGMVTGPSGEDNIPAPLAELPEKLTTNMLKKMQDQVDPRYLDKDKSPQKNDGDFMMSAEEIIKLPAENYHNQPLLDPDTAEYLEDQRRKNAYGLNQRVRREGVFYPIILRQWGNGQTTIFDGHHRLIAAYDNHPKFQVPYFLWEEEGNPEDEFTNFKPDSVNKEKSLTKRTMRRNKFVRRTHVLDRSVQAEAKALQLRTKQYVHDYYEIMSNAIEEKVDSPYTNPALRERIKDRVMAGSQGGRPGQWSARKAQLVAQRYRSAGGGYKKGRGKTKKQRSLSKWTKEKWRTSDGKPALRGGKMRRYLPDKVWGKLTPSQRAATNRKKIEGDKRGRQFVPNTETAERTAAKFRKKS